MSWECLKCKTDVELPNSKHKQLRNDCNCLYCHQKKCNGVLKGDLNE